jgi:hypothetical protein
MSLSLWALSVFVGIASGMFLMMISLYVMTKVVPKLQ